MTYSSAIAYLYGLQKHGIKLGLDTMQALMARLDRPERRFRSLHIGGTNGKGSTAAMAAAVLRAAGLRVGLYTSPHLVEFRERIRVNGDMISEQQVATLAEQVQAIAAPGLDPTFFEATTAMAFLHFAAMQVDVAVLEVGLGGRFDATNVVMPEACAITTIGLDHQEYLGRTEDAIAFEKAGIIKSGVPVIIGRMGSSALAVIHRIAGERNAPVWQLGRDFSADGEETERFTYRGRRVIVRGLSCRLPGRHQLDNAACALALVEATAASLGPVRESAIREGLASVQWEGRLEVVERHPTVVLDGAHNPAAALVLAEYLAGFRARHPDARLILVLGMMRDKDHRAFVAPLEPLVSEVVLTQAALARSVPIRELRACLADWRQPVHEEPVPAEALALAKRRATDRDLVCVTGSLMLLGDIKAALRGCGLSPLRG